MKLLFDQNLSHRLVSSLADLFPGSIHVRDVGTVDYILNRLAHGATEKDLLEEYPGLLEEDIRACYLFATRKSSDWRVVTVLGKPVSPSFSGSITV